MQLKKIVKINGNYAMNRWGECVKLQTNNMVNMHEIYAWSPLKIIWNHSAIDDSFMCGMGEESFMVCQICG